jgi:hypothetical protein
MTTWANRANWNWNQFENLYTVSALPTDRTVWFNNSSEALWMREFNTFLIHVRKQGILLQAALTNSPPSNPTPLQNALASFYGHFVTNYMTTPELTRGGATTVLPKTLVAINNLITAFGTTANTDPFKAPFTAIKGWPFVLNDPVKGLISKLTGLRTFPAETTASVLFFRDISTKNYVSTELFVLKNGKTLPENTELT